MYGNSAQQTAATQQASRSTQPSLSFLIPQADITLNLSYQAALVIDLKDRAIGRLGIVSSNAHRMEPGNVFHPHLTKRLMQNSLSGCLRMIQANGALKALLLSLCVFVPCVHHICRDTQGDQKGELYTPWLELLPHEAAGNQTQAL